MTRITTTTTASTAMTGPRLDFSPTLNAAPALWASKSLSDPTISMLWPSLR